MKVLFGMALRQTTGFAESLLQLRDLNWTVPDVSTLSRPLLGRRMDHSPREARRPWPSTSQTAAPRGRYTC
jgi:chorismate-pyruvate lyase